MTEHITPRDLADLRSMALEGMTVRQIAPMLGRTVGQVFRLLRTHRIPVRRERRPLTTMLVRRVREFAAMGLSVRMTAHLVDRSETSVEGIHHVNAISVAARPRKITTSVTDHCFGVLRQAGDRVGDPPHLVAGGLLELIVRGRTECAHAIVAPPPVAVSPGELRGIAGLQPSLQARM
jgi:hypothetical protein